MRDLKLSGFEGPLDLLLHLIEKDNLDITSISLVQVTDQYIAILHAEQELDVAALAEFVALGSKLLFLKSRALLPRPAEDVDEEAEEIAADLTEVLLEYRRYKEAALHFRKREEQGLRAYPRQAAPPDVPLPPGLDNVTLDTLMKLFQEALAREDREPPTPIRVLERETVHLRDKVEVLRTALSRHGVVSFRKLIAECHSRVEVIVQFLAILELIKLREVAVRQDALFADIELVVPALAVSDAGANEAEATA